jgi:hypothetical protein
VGVQIIGAVVHLVVAVELGPPLPLVRGCDEMWQDLREGSTKLGKGKRCCGPGGGGTAGDGGIPRDGGWEEEEGVGSGPLLYVGTLKQMQIELI